MKSTVENKILVDNQWIPYIIEYKKNKNIYFRVKEDGIIHVSCNKYVSQSYIKNLLEEINQIQKDKTQLSEQELKNL